MASRNIIKTDVEQSYYHVYARGTNKQPLFLERCDYEFFTGLFARYLSEVPLKSPTGVSYPHYAVELELLAYCLMPNHFHLLIYQSDAGAMTSLMRSLMTSYSIYFNRKYKRSGPLFESRYKASRISTQMYIEHISRYIHLNPRYWQRYPYSSFHFYINNNEPEWLKPMKIVNMFSGRQEYKQFVKDYEQHKIVLEKIIHELADK